MPLHAALRDFPQSQQDTFCDCPDQPPAEPGAVRGRGGSPPVPLRGAVPASEGRGQILTASQRDCQPGELHRALQALIKRNPNDPTVPGEGAEKRLICLLDPQKLAR